MARRRHPRVLIGALGSAQIVSWGTTYYAFPLFVLPMAESLGWSLTLLNGAATGGLLVTGLCAYPVGALIDRHGGRYIMAAGSLSAAALLALWSTIADPYAFYGIWLALGVCMAAILYEPVFAVLTQHFGTDARRAITALTLIAGFAGTVFIPLIETLIGYLPWRRVLLILAAFNLAICVPIHWWITPDRRPAHPRLDEGDETAGNSNQSPMRERLGNPVFWGLAAWFTAWSATTSGVMFQIVPYLKSIGVDTANMLIAVALVGPMQVTGRVIMMLFGARARTVVVGALVTLLLPASVLSLILLPPELRWLGVFAVGFGIANGILTILRGVAPAEWLGREHYGKLMGAIGAQMMVAAALAPAATAAIWSRTGDPVAMLWLVFGVSLIGTAGFWFAALARARRRSGAVDSSYSRGFE